MTSTARIGIKTDSSQAEQGIHGVRNLLTNLKQEAGKSLLQGFGIGGGIAAFDMLKRSVGAATDFMGESIRKAQEEDTGIAALTQSLKVNAAGWDGNMEAIERVISSREKLGFTDGEQRQSLALLVAITKDSTKALDLQREAMDLARLKNMDLTTATEVIGKVYGGNVGILTRYGIQIGKGATATQALAAVQKMAAGQAQAFANTSAGAAASTAAEFENLQEDIGHQLMPVFTALAMFARDTLIPALRGIVDVIGKIPAEVWIGIAAAITAFLVPALYSLAAAGVAAMIANPILLAIAASVGILVAAFTVAKPVIDNFAMDFGSMGDKLHAAADKLGSSYQAIKDKTKEFMAQGMGFDDAVAAAEKALTPLPKYAALAAVRSTDEMAAAFYDNSNKIDDATRAADEKIWRNIQDANAKAVAAARALPGDIAKALKQGEQDVKDGWKTFLDDQAHAQTTSQKLAYYHGILTSRQLAAGLKDARPEVRAEAQQVRQNALDQLALLQSGAAQVAVNTGVSLDEGLRQQRAKVGSAAAALAQRAKDMLKFPDKGPDSPYAWGSAIAKAWANGVASQWGYAHAKAIYLGTSLTGPLQGYSPPREGPLRNIDKWGENIGKAWAGGLGRGAGLSGLLGGRSPLVPAMAAVGGGGGVIHNHIYLDGRQIAESVNRHNYYMRGTSSRLPS